MRAIDISSWIGKKFGKLTVVDITRTSDKKTACVCYCDCDPDHINPIVVRASDIKRGYKLSCGCKKHDKREYRGSVKVGDRSGRLTVTKLPMTIHDVD